MRKYTVLICDDDIAVRDSLSDYLREDGFEVLTVENAEQAFRKIQYDWVDLAVFDVVLPGLNGMEACRKIRETYKLPVIMLSAKGRVDDRIAGLEAGADDYVTKPFSPRELVIRIQRLLERSDAGRKPRSLSFAELTVFPESNRAEIDGHITELTSKETRVLVYLVSNAGKVATREQILNDVWGLEYFGDVRVVDTLVKRLRKKICQYDVSFSIQSVYGSGYRMEMDK